MALGKATVNILANLKPLRRGLINARLAVTKMVSSISRGAFNILRAGLRKITALAKITAAALLGIGIASVKIAADAEETENLFTISMDKQIDAARLWVSEYSKSVGAYETDTKKVLGTLNVMLTSMGLTTEQAFDMAKSMTTLANDMASFFNIKPEEAFLKLQSGITGEIEPLKRLGILVNENTIKQLAMNDALLKNKKVLSEVEKIQLRYRAIMQQTVKAQGDMERTLDSTANVFRVVVSQLKVTANTIGRVFIPMVTKAAIAVRDWLINNQDQIKKWADALRSKIQVVVDVISGLFGLAKDNRWNDVFAVIGAILGNTFRAIGEFLKTNLPKAKELGKQMGQGLWAAIAETPLGKFLKTIPGKISTTKAVVSAAADVALPPVAIAREIAVARVRGSEMRLNPAIEERRARELQLIRRGIEFQNEELL